MTTVKASEVEAGTMVISYPGRTTVGGEVKLVLHKGRKVKFWYVRKGNTIPVVELDEDDEVEV